MGMIVAKETTLSNAVMMLNKNDNATYFLYGGKKRFNTIIIPFIIYYL